MMRVLIDAGRVLILFMAFDLLGFTLWMLGPQVPADSFYWGGVTGAILKFII